MRRFAHLAPSVVFIRDFGEGRVRVDSRGEPIIDYRLSRADSDSLVLGMRETARIHRAAGARRIFALHVKECSAGDGRSTIRDADLDYFLERIAQRGVRPNGIALFTAHPMGSARAGLDPKTTAAKPTGECHEVRNLWIGDGSIIPTAPGVNPMISIMALAVCTAGFIHEALGRSG
jgi:choline dehydrogenase-like flavoprotein